MSGGTRGLNGKASLLTQHMYSLSTESVVDVDEKHPDVVCDKTYQSFSNVGMLFRGSVNTSGTSQAPSPTPSIIFL